VVHALSQTNIFYHKPTCKTELLCRSSVWVLSLCLSGLCLDFSEKPAGWLHLQCQSEQNVNAIGIYLYTVCMHVCMRCPWDTATKAYRRGRGTVPLILNLSVTWGQRSTPHPGRFTPVKKMTVSNEKETEWAPDTGRRIRTRQKFLAPTGIRNSDRPAPSHVTLATTLPQLLIYVFIYLSLANYMIQGFDTTQYGWNMTYWLLQRHFNLV
jgi:hypothetical protein